MSSDVFHSDTHSQWCVWLFAICKFHLFYSQHPKHQECQFQCNTSKVNRHQNTKVKLVYTMSNSIFSSILLQVKKHLIFIFTAFAILTHISLTFYKKGRFSLFNGFQGTCILHSTYLRLTYSKYYVSKQFLLDMHVMGLVFYILVQPFSIANHIV